MSLNESIVEDAGLEWFGELGYAVGHGPKMAPGEPAAEQDSSGEVVLVGRLREAIRWLNPAIPEAGGGGDEDSAGPSGAAVRGLDLLNCFRHSSSADWTGHDPASLLIAKEKKSV